MLAENRRDQIKEQIINQKQVTVKNLSKRFDVSEVTIRKDLNILQQQGLIKKIHGGAIIKSDKKEIIVTNLKKKIATKAYEFVEKGDTLFIGSGDTCYHFSKLIKKEDHVSVITNNMSAIHQLQETCKQLYIIGGETIERKGLIFTGSKNSAHYFDKLVVNKAFTSSAAIDQHAGITVEKELSTYIFEAMKKSSKQWYLMVDSTKFDQVKLYKVGELSDITRIISNKIPEDYIKLLNANSIHWELIGR